MQNNMDLFDDVYWYLSIVDWVMYQVGSDHFTTEFNKFRKETENAHSLKDSFKKLNNIPILKNDTP
jgi:hypothetical protein